MIIKNIDIKNFGHIKSYVQSFDSGINFISTENDFFNEEVLLAFQLLLCVDSMYDEWRLKRKIKKDTVIKLEAEQDGYLFCLTVVAGDKYLFVHRVSCNGADLPCKNDYGSLLFMSVMDYIMPHYLREKATLNRVYFYDSPFLLKKVYKTFSDCMPFPNKPTQEQTDKVVFEFSKEFACTQIAKDTVLQLENNVFAVAQKGGKKLISCDDLTERVANVSCFVIANELIKRLAGLCNFCPDYPLFLNECAELCQQSDELCDLIAKTNRQIFVF